jgi:hypothetical protein
MAKSDNGTGLIQLLVGILVSIIGYLGNREFASFDEKNRQIDKHLESTDTQVSALLLQVALLSRK